MTVVGKAVFEYDSDTSGLKKGATEATTHLGGMKKAFDSVASVASGFVIGAGITQAPGALMGMARAAAEDEAATMRLDKALDNLVKSGGNSGKTFDQLQKSMDGHISAGQKMAFSDDQVRDSMQFLIAATGDYDEAQRRLPAAMDLARGAGIDLSTATKMLGKLNEENVEVFKKLGITLGENATEAEALAAVQAKFGGQADAYAKSTAGQFQKSQIAMAELQESIGYALLPVMMLLGQVLNGLVVPAITMMVQGITWVAENINMLLPVIIPLALMIGGALVPSLVAATVALWAKAAAWAAVAIAMIAANLPLIAFLAVMALIVAGIILLIQHWDTIVAKVPILGQAVDAVKAVFLAFVGWITGTLIPTIVSIGTKVGEMAAKVYEVIQTVWSTIEPLIDGYIKSWKLIIETFWKQVEVIFESALKIIKGIVDVFMGVFTGDWDRAWTGVKNILKGVWDGIYQTVQNGIALVAGLAGTMWNAAKALGDMFMDGLKAALNSTAGFAGDVADAVLSAIKHVVNTYIIDKINSALQFTIKVPMGPDIHINPPDIPRLARGGWARAGMPYIVGEEGPELFVPEASGLVVSNNRLGTGMQLSVRHVTINEASPQQYRKSLNKFMWQTKRQLRARGWV